MGKVDEESEKLLRVARLCLDEAIKVCKPGALFRDIGKIMWVRHLNDMTTSDCRNRVCEENLSRARVVVLQ